MFKFLRYFFHRCLAVSLNLLLLFIFSLVTSYFPYLKFVTFKTRVLLCNTLKNEENESRAFQNIGKYIPILFNQPCLLSSQYYLLLLVRPVSGHWYRVDRLSWPLLGVISSKVLISHRRTVVLCSAHIEFHWFSFVLVVMQHWTICLCLIWRV